MEHMDSKFGTDSEEKTVRPDPTFVLFTPVSLVYLRGQYYYISSNPMIVC